MRVRRYSAEPVDGIDAAREILLRNPAVRIVFVTVHDDAELVEKSLAIGALGYVLELTSGKDLVPSIHPATPRKATMTGRRCVIAASAMTSATSSKRTSPVALAIPAAATC